MSLPKDLNVIVIGKKPIANYVLDAIVMFNQGFDEIVIKGRGDLISKAVDVVNALRERLRGSLEIKSIEIGSEKSGNSITSYIKITIQRSF